nr:hypothetical protein BaRGS_024254 [Batillaria attramentaria]
MDRFIQTPGYDKVVRDLPFMDDWTRVVVPSGHVAMESPQVLDSDSIHVHFVNDKVRTSAGFKLLFSFHNRSSLPERVPSGKWNCSVPHWTDFQEHFPCDLRADCLDAEDEKVCPYWSDACGDGYCLPVYVRCNGVYDCPGKEDETACDSYTCSGFYRCRASRICVHADHLCDDVYHCPQRDDELLCGFSCPTNCTCHDFLMGVYLAIIGVADLVYKGTYLWNDVKWKVSGACKAAGFLSFLSSEVSAFIICLVTLDRFLVLRFPFSRLHFKKHSAHLTSALVWTIGLVLAVVPLLPVTSHWAFYSQTGICIPLPITRNSFRGHGYSFSVMIVLNFVLFLLIAAGQVFIYSSIRANSMSVADTSRKSRDLAIARRLLSVVVSDFLCWFPIGFLGLLASYGTPIPSEVSVAIAVFVLPVNSALNPFLYTLNAVRERRRKAASRQAMSSSRTVGERSKTTSAGTYSESQALELLETWLDEGVVSREGLRSRLSMEKEDSNVAVGTKDKQN